MLKLSESLYVNKLMITSVEFLPAFKDEDGDHPAQAWIRLSGAQSESVQGEAMETLRRWIERDAENW